MDGSRRQLAITGEYGEGKSTAMLEWCVDWARKFLVGQAMDERVPLLIELRGQSPSEVDPLTFLSGWASRFGLPAKQVLNLIKAGQAMVIFEGFDELRNAGREFDRHEHFNALWQFGYPGSKLIFTGRPNFFLGEAEKNRTLRADREIGASGKPYTELYDLSRLTEPEIGKAAAGFGIELGKSILSAARQNPEFMEIISRPSMLPVVATIWPEIEELQAAGHPLVSAVLIECYIKAIYRRKDAEIESDRRIKGSPQGASYLQLPWQVRDLFTMLVVWRMANMEAQNTIDRRSFDAVISHSYRDVMGACQADGVDKDIVSGVKNFIERHSEDDPSDVLDTVCTEVATAGLFVSDPAGGPTNLRFPHKQFYEFNIAKASWLILAFPDSFVSILLINSPGYGRLLRTYNRNMTFSVLTRHQNSIMFFGQITRDRFAVIGKGRHFTLYTLIILEIFMNIIGRRSYTFDNTGTSTFKSAQYSSSKRKRGFLNKLINRFSVPGESGDLTFNILKKQRMFGMVAGLALLVVGFSIPLGGIMWLKAGYCSPFSAEELPYLCNARSPVLIASLLFSYLPLIVGTVLFGASMSAASKWAFVLVKLVLAYDSKTGQALPQKVWRRGLTLIRKGKYIDYGVDDIKPLS